MAIKIQAEDLAQDVLLSLWQNLKKYDPQRGKFSTWAYRITANRCLDRLRRKKVDQLDENYDKPIPAKQHNTLFEKQVRAKVDAEMDCLPERQKLALVLFHYQGNSLQEIAEIMESSVDAIESLLARARRTLKTKLRPIWEHIQE